ncbi:MAG TPA: glucosaminidase domain-containing protein [Rhizomicrobium sp.]|nr:glucosaminidase domain-containing protein [Rhizomicrobium sp.]
MADNNFPNSRGVLEKIANGEGPWLNPQSDGTPSGDSRSRAAQFFDQQYDPVLKIALKRNVDPALLLALAAHESTYGTSPMYRDRMNPVGATPGGDGTPGLKYPSYDAAWADWDRMWGPRIQDVGSDGQEFIHNLLEDNQQIPGVDSRGPYNTQVAPAGDPRWSDKMSNMIRDVRNKLPQWQGNLDSYP